MGQLKKIKKMVDGCIKNMVKIALHEYFWKIWPHCYSLTITNFLVVSLETFELIYHLTRFTMIFHICFPKSRISEFIITLMEQHRLITLVSIKLCVYVISLNILISRSKSFFGRLIDWSTGNHIVNLMESFKVRSM